MSIISPSDDHDQIRRKIATACGKVPDGETPEMLRLWSSQAADAIGRLSNLSLTWQPHSAVREVAEHAVAEAVPVRRQPPLWLGEPDARFPQAAQRGEVTAVHSGRLKILHIVDGSVVRFGRFGLLTMAGDALIGDLSCPEAPLAQVMEWNLTALRRSSYIHRGSALVISDRFWEANYAHWLFDGLSRLTLMGPLREGLAVITTPIRFRWQIDMLTSVGIREGDIYELGEYECVSARSLYIADDVGGRVAHPAARAHPALIGAIRHRCGAPLLPARTENILLISRRRQGTRLLADEETLLASLRSRGMKVQCVELEDHRPDEQWRMFGAARAVIAVHGAALANVVTMRPATVLVEILPPTYANPAFWMVADAVGVDYIGVTAAGEASSARRPRHQDVSLSSNTIETIGDMLSDRLR